MHTMKKIISTTLVSVLLVAVAVPAFASGDTYKSGDAKKWHVEKFNQMENFSKEDMQKLSHPGKDKLQGKKQESPRLTSDKTLKDFTFSDGQKIKVHNKHVKFDVNPIIKEGRTLIPVRAITEALGADVQWDDAKSIVTITSADKKTVILFYLDPDDNGKVTVNGKEVTLDVKPGMVNHRTFVPMRFIAETLGCKVSHNTDTGETDIDDEKDAPALTPATISFANPEIVTDVTVAYSMNDDYDLVKIKNLTTVLDSDDYDVNGNKVTLEKAYVEDLTADKTVLTFVFEDSKDNLVERDFVIKVDQDGVYEAPALAASGVKFFTEDEIADAAVKVDWNDHTLTSVKEVQDGVSTVIPNTSYAVDGDTITFKKSFIQALEAGKTVLTLVFEAIDKELVNLNFTIEK